MGRARPARASARRLALLATGAVVVLLSPARAIAAGSVTWSGAPWYIEFAGRTASGWAGTAGGGVSDYGSRSAIKASLAQPRALLSASYASFGALGRKLDRSALDLITPQGRLIPLRRSVHFAPWGWSETLSGPGVRAVGTAFTAARDAFVFQLRVSATRRVRVRLIDFTDPAIDASPETPLRDPPPQATRVLGGRGATGFSVARTYGASLQNTRSVTIWRTWRLAGLRFNGGTVGHGSFSAAALSPAASGTYTVQAVMGVGLSHVGADQAAARGFRRLGPGLLAGVRRDWAAFLAGPAAPPPHVGASARRAYRLAMIALRMNLVAPVDRMRFPGTFPAKVSDTAFFGWDTPLNAWGMAEWGGWQPPWLPRTGFTLAEDMILLQLQAQTPRGEICYLMTENLRCQAPQWIQIPVQGWTSWQIAQRDPNHDRALRFIRRAYPGLARFFRYVIATHTGSDGNLQAYGAAETCDDSPRASLSDPPWTDIGQKQPQYEPIEYPVWMSAYATALANMATRLRQPAAAASWRREASALNAEVDAHWSASVGGWLDRRAGVLVDVRTPLMWWPAAFGTTSHLAWERTALTEHALNPAEFASYTPVPLVAVNSPYYNWATHGSYCQGESWLLFAYGTLMALHRAGLNGAASQLRQRMIATASRYGGIYEDYDAVTGQPGYAPGLQQPVAFNYGHSAAAIVEAIQFKP